MADALLTHSKIGISYAVKNNCTMTIENINRCDVCLVIAVAKNYVQRRDVDRCDREVDVG